MYIATGARPDLLGVTSVLASYLQRPMKSHIVPKKRELRYLNGKRIENST